MKFLDLFAGIGGFRLGLESVGHECVGYVEKDKFARQSYEAMHDTEGEWTRHDITEIKDSEWAELKGKVDIICGGFPCQPFSLGGLRNGFEDIRGTMFFEIMRAAKQIKPQFLLLENVKGLLNNDKGRTFGIILNTLAEHGYDVEWQMFNTKDYGLPQHRERLFIIGHLRTGRTRKVFPIRPTNPTSNKVDLIAHRKRYRRNTQVFNPTGITETLDTGQGGGRGVYVQIGKIDKTDENGDFVPIKDATIKNIGSEITGTITSRYYKGLAANNDNAVVVSTRAVSNPEYIDKIQNGRRFKDENEPMYTLTAKDKHGVLLDGEKVRIRKLTPKECFRLQGFSDELFEKASSVCSDSQLYKQAGNAVSVPVVSAIAKGLSIS